MQELTQLNLTYWFLQTVAMLITAFLIPNLRITSIFGAIFIVIALAFVNSKIWDAALFFHIPDTISAHSLLLFLTNGIIFWVLIKLLPGIEVNGFLPALAAPIIFTVTSILIANYAEYIDWIALLDQLIEFLQNVRSYFHQELGETLTEQIKNTATPNNSD